MKKRSIYLLCVCVLCLLSSCVFSPSEKSLAGQIWYQKARGAPEEMLLGYKFLNNTQVELMQGITSLGMATYTVSGFSIKVKHSCGTQVLFKVGNRFVSFINGFPIWFVRKK